MAMLAEPRIKQKWCLNPRGSVWSQDDNKLGQRLLEKMGWSKGKGLGKKEDGNPDHVKVSYKNDSKGMGFKGYDDAWVSHQDDFNALLTSLHKTSADSHESTLTNTVELKSLEEKSLKSRKRVHYHKFIRGKDLSKRSAKDLQCIFGKREPSGDATPMEEVGSRLEVDEGNKSAKDSISSANTINSGSMQHYFAEKLAKLKSRHSVDARQENLITAEENTSALTVKRIKRKKLPAHVTSTDVDSYMNGRLADSDLPKKKKKKKGLVLVSYDISEAEVSDSTVGTNNVHELGSSRENGHKTKSKNGKLSKEKLLLDHTCVDEKLGKKKLKLEQQNESANLLTDSKTDAKESYSKSKEKVTELSIFENGSKKTKRHKIDDRLEESSDNFPQKKHKIESRDENIQLLEGKSTRAKDSVSNKTSKKSKRSKIESLTSDDNLVDGDNGNGNDVALKTCATESISQDEVANMRNAALVVLRTSRLHRDDTLACSGSQDAVKDDKRGQVSGSEPLKLKTDSVIENDDSLQTNMVNTYNRTSLPENLCLCKSGYGAYNRLPWEVVNSIGYYRKLVRPDNLALVEEMRKNNAFKNSNIFEITGYEVLPPFKCCCQ